MEVYWCHQNTLHLSCGEMGDSKEENQWKLEVVDLAVRLMSFSLPPQLCSSLLGGYCQLRRTYFGVVWCVTELSRVSRLRAANPMTVARSAGRTGQAAGSNGGMEGERDGRRRAQIEWQLVQVGDSLVTVMEGEKLHRTLSSCSYGHCYPLQHCRLSLLLKTQQRFQICAVKADNSVWTHCSRADCAHSATALNPGHSSG